MRNKRRSDIQHVLTALVVVLKTSEVENTFLKLIMTYKSLFAVSFFMLRPSRKLTTVRPEADVKDRGTK